MIEAMQAAGDVQTATVDFFVPVAAAYAVALAGWWWITWRWPRLWPTEPDAETSRPWMDLGVCVLVILAVLEMGQVYRQGWLIPGGLWSYAINQVLIYSPLFLGLALRRQGGNTIWVTGKNLLVKVGIGLALGVVAVAVFQVLRGDMNEIPGQLAIAVAPRSLAHFFPVFMEGVGVAFVFIRLRWKFGVLWATLGPALLFAAAHVPRGIESGSSALEIAAFFLFNTSIVAVILQVLRRSRDVIWIGLVHYLVDIPAGAF